MKRFVLALLTAVTWLTMVPIVSTVGATSGNPIRMTVTVEGLEANDEAVLRIGVDDGSLKLSGQPIYEYTVKATDAARNVEINTTLEDGRYILVVDAPENYFREPRGYLFMVYQAEVVNLDGRSIPFKLIPPEARDYEPYRGPIVASNATAPMPPPPSASGEVTYRVESVVGLSAPPKEPIEVKLPPTMERIPVSYWVGLLGAGVGILAAVGVIVFVVWRTLVRRGARGRGG